MNRKRNNRINQSNISYPNSKKRMDIHREELMKNVFHPRRLAYYLELGYDMFD